MKRFSLLKKIGIVGATASAICPIVLTATSCSPTSILTEAYSFEKLCDFDGEELETKLSNISFTKLLYGSFGLSDGNYVLFVGSNMFDNTCKFFTNDAHERDRKHWFRGENLVSSSLYAGAKQAQSDSEATAGLLDFNLYNAIEFFNGELKDTKGHEYFYSEDGKQKSENIGPFDTWTTAHISATKAYNWFESPEKYEWDEESVEEGDYIRTDALAKQYRALCELGKILYPTSEEEGGRKTTFNTDNDNSTSLIVIFRKGKIQTIEDLPSSPEAFAELLTKYLTKDDPEPDPEEWR